MPLYRMGGKRLFDLALASVGLVVFAVPMLLIALRIYGESGRISLFRQTRIGFEGRPFIILKFRTMSETGLVSSFCQLLRSTAMDELPQLIHIVRGQMSFVGPRPIVPEDLKELDRIPGGEKRLGLRPGLTGLAQVNSEKVPSPAERLKWDLSYAERCSLWLDIRILVRSVQTTLKGAWEKTGGPS